MAKTPPYMEISIFFYFFKNETFPKAVKLTKIGFQRTGAERMRAL